MTGEAAMQSLIVLAHPEQRRASREGTIPEVVAAEIERLDRADLLSLQYPMWWHLPPAMLSFVYLRYEVLAPFVRRRERLDLEQGSDDTASRPTQPPPGAIAPIARNPKMSTSCTKWMNHAHARPRVSSMDFARIQPRNHASATPTMPYGMP
jgi:hypothetical protein